VTELRVDHAGGSLLIGRGSRVTFGRSAQVKLTLASGEPDPALHNEAFGITVLETGFMVDAQSGHREVRVTRLPLRPSGRRERSRVLGGRIPFTWDSAEIAVTATIEHRVNVVVVPAPNDPGAEHADTGDAWPISMNRRGDRLLVAMCRDRLEQLGAPALSYEEAVMILSGAGRHEDRRIKLSSARSEVRRAIDEIENFRRWEAEGLTNQPIPVENSLASQERRDWVVDWLVSRHVVTAELYDLVATPVVA
jgi:hypothetical protein